MILTTHEDDDDSTDDGREPFCLMIDSRRLLGGIDRVANTPRKCTDGIT
jgi:hypothetical protein